MSELPPDLVFGKVIGSFVRTAADGPDVGTEPDSEPAVGTIKFTPLVNYQRALTPDPVTVSLRGVLCTLDATGTLVDAQGATGLWLATGAYSVVFTLKGIRILPTTIVVTEAHTDLAPLDLAIAIPPEGPPIGAGQYAELSERIENVETGGGVTDHGALTGLGDDDHTQYALADGSRGAFATVAQGILAASAVQPAGLTSALTAYALVGHNHDGVYALAGHNHTGVYATAAQGTKADTAVQPAALSAYALTSHNHDGTYATAAQGTLAASASQPGHVHAAGDTTSGVFSTARLPGATAATSGIVELATTTEATTGTDTTRAVTAAGVKAVADLKAALSHTHGVTDLTATGTKDATTFLRGDNVWAVPAGGGGGVTDHGALTGLGDDDHTQYLTQARAATYHYTKAQTDTYNEYTASLDAPAGSGGKVISTQLPAATETVKGVVELATVAEATTGTDTTRAVTAAGVKAVADTKVGSSDASVLDIVNLTQAEYDALSPPVATTLYVVTP